MARWHKGSWLPCFPTTPLRAAAYQTLMQGERECSAFFGLPFCGDPASVAPDDPLHRGEADARTGEIVRMVKPLKGAEQLRLIRRIESGPVVAHEVGAIVAAKFYARGGMFRGELPGISEEILQHYAHQVGVAVVLQIRRDDEFHRALRLRAPQIVGNRFRDGGKINARTAQRTTGDAREVQQVVNEDPHTLRGGTHALKV